MKISQLRLNELDAAMFRAFYQDRKDALERDMAAKRATIEDLGKAVGKGTWRERVGQVKGSPALDAAEKSVVAIQAMIDRMDAGILEWKGFMETYQGYIREEEEMNAFVSSAGLRPKPVCIQRIEDAFMAEMMAGCVSLRIPKSV